MCHDKYERVQKTFPLKPTFDPPTTVDVDRSALKRQGVKQFTRKTLQVLNNVYQAEVGTSFTKAVSRDNQTGLQQRMSENAKKKEKRKMQRQFTTAVNQKYAENAAVSLLVEGESKRQYHRKRLSQSFTSPESSAPPAKKHKSHSPSFENVEWDTEKLLDTQ